MKNISKYMIIRYVSVFLISCITFSCSDDFFNQQAGNQIEPKVHYQSTIDLGNSMDGVLSPLQKLWPNLIMLDGLRSDQMDITSNYNANITSLYNQKFDASNPFLDLSGFYQVIINANEVLANINRVTEADPTFDEFYQKQARGALICIRAWAYFQLLRLNGEAAYIPDNMVELPSDLTQKFIPKDAMIDTLINQLIPYIHTDQSTDELNFSYYPNSKALLGELYLEKNDYANAVIYLKMAMESYGNDTRVYKVDKTYAKEGWLNIFLGGVSSSTENIGVIMYNATENQSNPLATWMRPTDEYLVKPSSVIYSEFVSQVPLKGSGGDKYRGVGVSIDTLKNANETFIKKYSLIDGIDGYSLDIPFMRCADIHLLLAEALNRMGEKTLALILLNRGMASLAERPADYISWSANSGVRGRVYLSVLKVPENITDETQIMETIEDFIIEERSMELAFEGYRMFDLMRIAKRRANPDYLANRVAAKYPADMQDQVKNFLRNESNWYIPMNK
jgi:starch-binding outer membrane protein, SusD/RagB family